jgi:hypothetical protein
MRSALYDITQEISWRFEKSVELALCQTGCTRFSVAEWLTLVNTALGAILTL